MVEMFPLFLSLLLGWTEVAKTQSRRQSGLVCSLLVVSLLLSAVVGEEACAGGFLPHDAVNMYGPGSRSVELPSTLSSRLYVFSSMNFSCNGTITDIRMRMDFVQGLQTGQSQIVWVYFLLFRDRLNSPTRRVLYILLNRTNTEQYFDSSTQRFAEIWQTHSLSLPVTEGSFIGFAVPANDTRVFMKNINLSPTSERVETHFYQLAANFSTSEEEVLEAARTADSSQFTTQMIALPLIDVSVSPDSSTGLSPSPTAQSSSDPVSSVPPTPTSTPPPPQPPPTPSSPSPSDGITLIAVVGTIALLLLLLVVVVVVAATIVIVKVTAICRSRDKEHVYENDNTNRGVRFKMTDNSMDSTTHYEPMSLGMDPTHSHHQPHPLHTSTINTPDTDVHISMQANPAYQSIADTPTSGEYTYI